MQYEQSFGAGGQSPGGRSASASQRTPQRMDGQRSPTPNRGQDSPGSPRSPAGGSASPRGQELMIHPSHRGTNYFRKPPKKKKKKRKKPKSPVQGQAGVLFIPEDGPATRLQGNPDDPYYKGSDLDKAGPAGAGSVGLAAYLASRRRSDDKYWRAGGAGADGQDGSPGGAGGVAGAGGAAGADGQSGRGSAGGAILYPGDEGYDGSDGRSGRGGLYGAGASPGGGVQYVGNDFDDAATDAERLDKADYRGGGGAKRVVGDLEEDQGPTGWTTRGGITKRPKQRKRSNESIETPLRSQKELYVDYDKLAEIEQQEVKTYIGPEVDDPDKFWELIDPDEDDEKQYIDDNYITHLSYKKVKMHQYRTHPRNRATGRIYPCCSAHISFIPICMCCINKAKWVTPAAREIGIGPTLFLMTNKAFAYLFLFFIVLNSPLFYYYSTGGQAASADDEPQDSQFTDIFAVLSLGNLGVSGYACSNVNIAQVGYNSYDKKKFTFVCPYGTMRQLTQFGIQKIDNQSCVTPQGYYIGEYDRKDDLQLDCNFENGLSEFGKKAVMEEFDSKCFNKQSCEMKLQWSWFNSMCRRRIWYYSAHSKYTNFAEDLKWHFYRRNAFVREPVLFGVVFCVADQMYDPSGQPMDMYKGDFVYVILTLDFIVIFLTIWMINLLEWRYKQYAKLYDKRAVEMRDFTVIIRNLPPDFEFGGKDLMLQAQLWNHIEITLEKAIVENAEKNNDFNALNRARADKLWEIVDITFGKSDLDEQEQLEKLDEKDREKKKLIRDVQLLKMDKENPNPQPKIDELEKLIVERVKEFKIMKQEYVRSQEEKLYEKYEITETNGRSTSDQSFQCAYVTFRSMQGKEKAMQCFQFAKDLAKQDETELNKMFFHRWLRFEQPPAPTSMIWKHQIYSECSRFTRKVVIWILAFGIIIAAFYLMVFFKNLNDELTLDAGINVKCPKRVPSIEEVIEDQEKPVKQRQGFRHCWCLQYQTDNGSIQGSWDELKEVEPKVTDLCAEWESLRTTSQLMILITGILIGAINGICVFLFEVIPVFFEKCLTYAEETLAQFNRIFVIQFLNIGCLLLFVDFGTGYSKEEAGVPFLVGKHRDFDTAWYYDIGAKITVAMISNSLVGPFASKAFQPFMLMILNRWFLDRCCKKHLRKLHNYNEMKRKEEAERAEKAQDGENNPENPEEGEGGEREDDVFNEGGYDSNRYDDGGDDTNRDLTYNKDATSFDEGGDDDQDAAGPKPPGPGEGEFQLEEDDVETKQYFQDDLNELYTGRLIETFYPYSWFFTNLMIYYMYCGAMPFMYILGFLHFTICYWCWKWLLFTYFRKSYNFDEMVPMYAVTLMKYCVFVHLLMILFMYTNKRLLTPQGYTTKIHYRPPKEPPHRFFRKRFDIDSTQVVLYTAITIVACYLVYRFIILVIWQICQTQKERKKAAAMENDDIAGDDVELKVALADDHSDDIYKEFSIRYLRDLYIRSKKEFEQFRTMFNAISYDQNKLNDEYAKHFKKKLKNRINNIEDTIDVHCNLIGGLERWMDQSYMYKLAALEVNEEKIPLKDEKCQRLVDLVQSYYIYDSLEYSKPKQIMQRIDREMLELDVNENEAPVYC